MKSPFGRKKEPGPPNPDAILDDLPRGQERRLKGDNFLPFGFFELPEELATVGFSDQSGDNFLGLVNGSTKKVNRKDGRIEFVTTGGVPVGCKDDRHITVVAGSRSGKGRSFIIPNLLSYNGSTIVIDPKGENAAITARYRAETLGQRVHILDPFRITPKHCETYRRQFNPMEILSIDNPTIVEDAGLIADALVVSQHTAEPHWDQTAKAFIEGILLHVASSFYPPEEQTLMMVAELLTGKQLPLKTLLQEMTQNLWLDGRVAAAANTILEMPDNERGSVISTARRHLKFLDYDALYSVFSGHDFDLDELKTQKATLYLVLPAMRMHSCKQFLRLFVNLTLGMVEQNTTVPEYPVQMILDEMPTLSYMEELERAIGQVAGLGLRLICILQDLGQLKALYRDRFQSFLANSGALVFFGNVDQFTSQWVSDYLGKTTIRVAERTAISIDDRAQGRSGQHYRNQTVELMAPAEVRRYFARDDRYNRMLVCIPGKRPWILQRAHYDSHALFAGRFDSWR